MRNLSDKFSFYMMYALRMMIQLTRMGMNLMENAPVPKSMQKALNLLENFC